MCLIDLFQKKMLLDIIFLVFALGTKYSDFGVSFFKVFMTELVFLDSSSPALHYNEANYK